MGAAGHGTVLARLQAKKELATIMSTPQTGHIPQSQTPAVQKPVYANAFRAELRGDGRTAGGARFAESLRSAESHQAAAADKTQSGSDSGGGFIGFIKTVIDIINPLQHIPVISTMYRHLTGDELSPVARIAGGTLYGGPIGAAMGVVNAAVESSTGKDLGGNMLAMVSGDDKKLKPPAAAPATMLAQADIIWHSPAPTDTAAATALAAADIKTNAPRTMQMAARMAQEFPPSDTPTTLRTQTGGDIALARGSLPSVPPVIQPEKGMSAPTQTADRTHNGSVAGAGRSSAPDVGERNYATHPAKASPSLQSQNAPALAARRASTPEQIANLSTPADRVPGGRDIGVVSAAAADTRLVPQQMMAALDKYAALKKSQDAAAASRLVPSYH